MKRIMLMMVACVACFSVNAQIKTPQPSPSATIKQAFGLGEITIVYSRPAVKGRTIFGDLVPYDKMWRTGANASTKISFSEDVTIGGNKVPAGDYALYTIPGKTEWTVMINKNTKLWGAGSPGDYKQEEDVARIKVKPVANQMTESFTIDISDVAATSAMINLSWDKTKVSFRVETSIDDKIQASIEKSLNPKVDANTYFSAASYYYENNKDMSRALEWINRATDLNKDAFWMMHLKAKIQRRMNDNAGAVASAKLSREAAQKASNDDYVALNDKLIAEINSPAPAKKK